MRKLIIASILTLGFCTVFADDNSYIVKTKNVKKVEAKNVQKAADDSKSDKQDEPQDFVGKNFKFYSLCDWMEGMKFMVMPEKYDLIVNTFCDGETGKEVSSMKLRHKIMIYKGHTSAPDGHDRVNFICQDDNKSYYYQIPSGTFDDYCYNKMGVPTLAYLGDVDIARELLMGKHLYTRSQHFNIDTEYDGDGYQEIQVPMNSEVEVTAVGVGTRSFPVKIIVQDKSGREFFQLLALSKINSGMRDDEFIMDKTRHLFANSFELADAMMTVSEDYMSYLDKVVHTLHPTNMVAKGDGRERTIRVPKLMAFRIDRIMPKKNSDYCTLLLRETDSGREYTKEVTFKAVEDVTGELGANKEDFFGYIFAMGEGKVRETSQAARAAIRQGRVILNMDEEEVEMAMGEPNDVVSSGNGRTDWIYRRSKGKLLIVQFGANGRVIGYKTGAGNTVKSTSAKSKKK